MATKSIIVLGGGISGLAAALTLLEGGVKVVLLEKEKNLGGVAGWIKIPERRLIPAGYHHIVGSDQEMIRFLKKLKLMPRVKWKNIRASTLVDGKEVNLSWPIDMLRYKYLPFVSRLRYLLFGARCILATDWQRWEGRSVTELVRTLADQEVLEKIFRPLVDIKFGMSTDEVDAAWLGKRLSHREGVARYGYIPNACWTKELCGAFQKRIIRLGGVIRTGTAVKKISLNGNGEAEYVWTQIGEKIPARGVVSTLPPPVLRMVLPVRLPETGYIFSYSLIAGLGILPFKDYWSMALYPRRIFGACFTPSVLNETLKTSKDKSVINLFTNVPFGKRPWTVSQYERKALSDLGQMAGQKIKPNWVRTNIIKFSSPVFRTGYKNPSNHLGKNLYLAGIYNTYPRFSSMGEAMSSGEATALEMLKDLGKTHE